MGLQSNAPRRVEPRFGDLHSRMGGKPEQPEDRIERLEHAAGYADHHVEILSSEVTELNKAMMSMARRIERLESRLIELNAKVGDEPPHVPPPHSAGPDIPREPL